MEVQAGSSGLRITASDLTLDTELETESDGNLTVRELLARGDTGKVRCQTPFRQSESFAAFFNVGKDGRPFVFDVGTGITHWLVDKDSDGLRLATAMGVIKLLLPKATGDCGAPFEPDAIAALAVIKKLNPAEYQRVRSDLRKANKDISVIAIDQAIKAQTPARAVTLTHHGYASDLLVMLTVDRWPPVGYEGSLYVVDPADGLWVRRPTEALERMVAEKHDGKENCERRADYSGIAQHAISLAADEGFFADAPVGLACPDGLYLIVGDKITREKLTPAHRQRVKLDVTPKQQPTPIFCGFLHETFQSANRGEEEQQLQLVQEIAGAIMLGIMHKYQKAALFYDPFGRAGKGTLERIMRRLVPNSFVTAVSPFVWDKEYYVASLAGTRLNVVGELPDDQPIPAAVFKTVTGGDLITGRHPTHRPISFRNEAGHLFMSNHMINTRDHSEAFFPRWLIVEFPNSRIRTGLPLDPTLPDRIIDKELPGIAQWAMDGAVRLMANGGFSQSAAHDRLMAQWRRSTNNLEEFIHDCCELDSDYSVRRSDFYRSYGEWCLGNRRRAFAKGRVRDLLAHNVGFGISLLEIGGYETFRGIQVKVDPEAKPDVF
jgi:P4 family phage/plasmid primase-like protien